MSDLTLVLQARNQAASVLNQVSGQMSEIKDKADSISSKLKDMSSSLGTAGAGLTAGLTLPIVGLAKASIEGAAKQEQLRVAFTTMLGSAEKAKSLMSELQDFAAATPFEQDQVVEAGKKLLAFGTDASKVKSTLTQLGDIASGVGAPIQDLATIFGQAQVSGRLMTGDINQLVGRGIPIIKALAQNLGVAEGDIRDLAEHGKISFEDFQGAIANLTKEGGQFGGMMEAQSRTLTGMWSTVKDQVSITLTTIGENIITTFDLGTKLQSALEWLTSFREHLVGIINNNPELFRLALIFGGIAAGIGPALLALAGFLRFMSFLGPAISVVSGAAAFLVSPIGLIAAALGIMVHYDILGFGTALQTTFNWLKNLVTEIGSSTTMIKYWIEAMSDAGVTSSEAWEVMENFPPTLKSVAEAVTSAYAAFLGLKDGVQWILEGKAENIDWWQDVADNIGSIIGLSTEAKVSLGNFLYEGGVKVQNFIGIIEAAFGPTIDRLFGNVQSFGSSFGTIGTKIGDVVNQLLPLLQNLGTIIGFVFGVTAYLALNILSAAFDQLDDIAIAVLTAISTSLEGFNQMIGGVIKVAVSLFQGDWAGAWEGAKRIVDGWQTGVNAAFELTKSLIASGVAFIGTLLSGVLSDFGVDTTTIDATIQSIVAAIKSFNWPAVPAAIESLVQWIWPEVPASITSLISWVWPGIPLSIRNLLTWAWPAVPAALAALLVWVWPDVPEPIKQLILWLWPDLPEEVGSLLDWTWPDLPSILSSLLDWTWPTLPIPQAVLNWLGSSTPAPPPQQAVGAGSWSGGPVIVGDGGPELIIPPRGTEIVNNRETKRAIGGLGGGSIVVNVTGNTVRSDRDIDLLVNRVIAEITRRRN